MLPLLSSPKQSQVNITMSKRSYVAIEEPTADNIKKGNSLQKNNFAQTNYEQKLKMQRSSQMFLNTNRNSHMNPEKMIQHIDNKIEFHQREIEARNDMIEYIEKAVSELKNEVVKEKKISDEKQKQIVELQMQIQVFQQKNKTSNQKNEELQKQVNSLEKEKNRLFDESSRQISQAKQQESILKQEISNLQNLYEQTLKTNNQDSEVQQLKKQLHKLELEKQQGENETKAFKCRLNEINERLSHELSQNQLNKKNQDEKNQKNTEIIKNLNNEVLQLNKKIVLQNNEIEQFKVSLQNSNEQLSLAYKQDETLQQLKEQLKLKEKEKDVKKFFRILFFPQDQKEQQEFLNLKEQFKNNQQQVQLLEQKINEQTKQLEEKKSLLEKIQLEKSEQQKIINQLKSQQESFKNQIDELQKRIMAQLNKQTETQTKNSWLTQIVTQLETSEKEIMKNLTCTFCKKFIKQPVTIIPCGHSFCFECKKGYGKECSTCGPKVKIEAMYRNELLDDIIVMVKLIQNSVQLMKQQK